MANCTQVNGTKKQKQKKVMVFKSGQMGPNMKDSGIMIWLVALEDSY